MMSIQDRNQVIYELTLESLSKGKDSNKILTEFGYFKYFFFSERIYIYIIYSAYSFSWGFIQHGFPKR